MMDILKKSLGQSQCSLGSWISLAHPAIAEIIAKAGFEWLVIDMEHSVITIREAEELIRVIDLCGAKPYVRLTANDPNQIKRILDAGARGIIVPMVKSAKDVEQAAKAMFYPPRGTRSVGLARAQGYGADFKNYVKKHYDFDLIVQIEHIDAVEHLEEIFSFPGLLGFMVGPYDLSGSMGMPGEFENSDFQHTLNKIQIIANKYPHVKRGIHLVEPDLVRLKKAIEEQYHLIAYSVDFRILDVCVRSAINQFKEFTDESGRHHSSSHGSKAISG